MNSIMYWASLGAQLIKNTSVVQETWVQSLDCDDPLEKGKATHSSILAWRILEVGDGHRVSVHGVTKSWTGLCNFHFQMPFAPIQTTCKNWESHDSFERKESRHK